MQYSKSEKFEKLCNEVMVPVLFDSRYVQLTPDYETNHNHGIDCYISVPDWGIKKVDFKFRPPYVDIKNTIRLPDFCVELAQYNGKTWIDEGDDDVYICHFWFKDHNQIVPKFYHKSYIKKIRDDFVSDPKNVNWVSRTNTGGTCFYVKEQQMEKYAEHRFDKIINTFKPYDKRLRSVVERLGVMDIYYEYPEDEKKQNDVALFTSDLAIKNIDKEIEKELNMYKDEEIYKENGEVIF